MSLRLKEFLCFVFVFILFLGISAKANPQIDEIIEVEESKDRIITDDDKFYDGLYKYIVSGEADVDLEDKDLPIRAKVEIEEKPKQEVRVSYSGGGSSRGQSIANYALSLVGKPYVFGASGPNSFDCSGFVLHVFKQFGINLPRTSQSQAYYGKRISRSELQPGDLIFSNTYSSLSHVGDYVGNGKFVHAANYGTGVTVSLVNDSYYGPRYAWSTRPY